MQKPPRGIDLGENLPVKGLNQTYDLHTGQD